MRELVRVLLKGDVTGLRSDWEKQGEWPFSVAKAAVLPADSEGYARLQALALAHPEVRISQFVEREYTKRELLEFPAFLLWTNSQISVSSPTDFRFEALCPECGFAGKRVRTGALDLSKQVAPNKDMSITDDWERVVSERVVQQWNEAGFTGAKFASVLVEGAPSVLALMEVESNVPDELPETLCYAGTRCTTCGRYERSYPVHPSKELWIPRSQLPASDIAFLNANLERTYHPKVVISNRAYRLLTDMKATGFWVQPVHTV